MGVWTKSFTQFEGVMTFEVFESQRPDTVCLHFWMKSEDSWLLFSKVRFFLRYICWKLEVWGNIYRHSSLRDRILCLFISGWNQKTLGCYFQKFGSFSAIFAEGWKFEGVSVDIRFSSLRDRKDTLCLHFWMKSEDSWLLFSKVWLFLSYLCWKLEVWRSVYWHSRFSSLRDRILCLLISGWNRKTLGCYFQKFVSFSDIFAENLK
jgi:hypothetical protein